MMFSFALNYNKGPVYLKDVATEQDISFKYLSKIVIPLKSAGMLHAVRGANGGYMLAKQPSEITIRQIVEKLEGSASLVECIHNTAVCSRHRDCVARKIWTEANGAIMKVLEDVTLQDMIDEYTSTSGSVYDI